jgi:hypothetical protein
METNEKLEKINENLSRILDTKIELKSFDELNNRFVYKLNNEELQKIAIPIMEIFLDDEENFKNFWRSLNSDIQANVGETVIDLIGDRRMFFSEIWDVTWEDAQDKLKDKVLEKYSDNKDFLLEFFLGASGKIQEENKDRLPEIVELVKSKPNYENEMLYLWLKMSKNLQVENSDMYDEVLQFAKNLDEKLLINLWIGTASKINKAHPKIHRDVIKQITGKAQDLPIDSFQEVQDDVIVKLSMNFGDFSQDIQREYLPMILENIDKVIYLPEFLEGLDKNVKIDFLPKIIDLSQDLDDIISLLDNIPEETIESNLDRFVQKVSTFRDGSAKARFFSKIPEQYRTVENLQKIWNDEIQYGSDEMNEIICEIPKEEQERKVDELLKYSEHISPMSIALKLSDNFLKEIIQKKDIINSQGQYMLSAKNGEAYPAIKKELSILLEIVNDDKEYKTVLDALMHEYSFYVEKKTPLEIFKDEGEMRRLGQKDVNEMEANLNEFFEMCYNKAKANPEYLKIFIRNIPAKHQAEIGSSIENNVKLLWPDLDESKSQEIISRYNSLQKYNSDLAQTIDLDFLKSDVYACFSLGQLGRITSDIEFQKKLLAYDKNPMMLKVIEHVVENRK